MGPEEQNKERAVVCALTGGVQTGPCRSCPRLDLCVNRPDPVSSPNHYASGGLQAIEAFHAMVTPDEFQGAMKFNIHKYLWRHRKKGGIEDVRKAQQYFVWLLNSLNNEDLEVNR